KSREQWIKLGSKNTSFFHAQSVIRRKRNKIHGIKLPSGDWCTDPDIMKAEALNFFKDLFCTRQQVCNSSNEDDVATLDDFAIAELVKPVSKKEVHDALMNMKSYKAPGPDGFQPIFFKLFWDVVGDDVWNFVKLAFERGRSTKDNAIVLQEVLHFMRKSKKKNGDMVFKLDLEKAYDRVNWSFLRETMAKFNFPPILISLIMFGITSSSNTILWNGSKTEPFTPTRGLRQGDPLSPYLFVLCMERLGAMINNQVRQLKWKPMQMTRNGTKLSHLFFADDVLLFGKATSVQAKVIDEVLKKFCAMSGLKISLEKSKFCTSTGVTRHTRDTIANVTQIHATDRFKKYLGFKMFYGQVRKQDFSDVYDRVNAKLASWKSRLIGYRRVFVMILTRVFEDLFGKAQVTPACIWLAGKKSPNHADMGVWVCDAPELRIRPSLVSLFGRYYRLQRNCGLVSSKIDI
ncbi:ribonuclease H, partial [Trifolium pratense]